MNLTKFKLLVFATVAITSQSVAARQPVAIQDSSRVFNLGEVTILADNLLPTSIIDATTIAQIGAQRIPEAISWIPGITLTEVSSRGETLLFLRGFDQSRIPIFVDGIPVYVPFDGYIDLGRLQTSSVSKIEVSKGTSSLLLGGNTMGGSVNIISSRPINRFEASIQASTLWNSSISLGTKQKYWYAQINAGWIGKSDFRLPSEFKAVDGLQDNNIRHHSNTQDWQLAAKIGITPRGTDEYVVGYNMIRANKYVPPYLGKQGKARFWEYKDWDKDQVFFRSRTQLASNIRLSGHAFYDRYYNLLKAYDDINYNTQKGKQAFDSYYDDYSLGIGASLAWRTFKNNELTLAANYKNDNHRSHDDNDPTALQSEGTGSIALEDNWTINKKWSITAGVGYFMHRGYKIQQYEQLPNSKDMGLVDYPTSSDNDFNYQLITDWRAFDHHAFRFSFARSSRFSSLKDRYSYKRGKAIPNPDLKTENSYNFDITYTGNAGGFSWYASLYYMMLTNTIQEITNIDPSDPKIWQLQNKGRADYRGVELGLNYHWSWVGAEVNYTYINRRNIKNPELKFLEVPENTLNARIQATPIWGIRFEVNVQARSKAWSSSDGSTYAPGFGIMGIRIDKTFDHLGGKDSQINIQGGINNVFDKLYYYSEGFPMEGRRFYLSATYRFNIK